MGNQITATAPAQILPLESYFNELTEYSKPIRWDEKSVRLGFAIIICVCQPIDIVKGLAPSLSMPALNLLIFSPFQFGKYKAFQGSPC